MLGGLLRIPIQYHSARLRHDLGGGGARAWRAALLLFWTTIGSEIYVAYGQAGLLRAYPVASAIALQFRNGRLTGWKKDWRLRRFLIACCA